MPPEPGPPLRLLLGAFGDPGHAFPMIALGRALKRRGHDVTVQTYENWRAHVEGEGIAFEAAPEYPTFPTRAQPLKPYEAVLRAAQSARPLVAQLRPHVVVSDILTLAPALAAELEGVPNATLIPHVHPRAAPGFAPYSLGARLPRTRLGRAMWKPTERLVHKGLEIGRGELNETRRRLGLEALDYTHGGISRKLCLIATYPQLEYPRTWAPHEHVIGPLLWEPPSAAVEIPAGEQPLVLVAPSTSQDLEHRLLRAALDGLRELPVRVLATWNRRTPHIPLPQPTNAHIVEWLSYASTMGQATVVVCHGGHGTMARALRSRATVVAAPAAGDMAENAARLDWAGAGVRVPHALTNPTSIRLAVMRALSEPHLRARAAELAHWSDTNDPGDRAGELIERLARG